MDGRTPHHLGPCHPSPVSSAATVIPDQAPESHDRVVSDSWRSPGTVMPHVALSSDTADEARLDQRPPLCNASDPRARNSSRHSTRRTLHVQRPTLNSHVLNSYRISQAAFLPRSLSPSLTSRNKPLQTTLCLTLTTVHRCLREKE